MLTHRRSTDQTACNPGRSESAPDHRGQGPSLDSGLWSAVSAHSQEELSSLSWLSFLLS